MDFFRSFQVLKRLKNTRFNDTVYHVGASFKDLGKKLTAFSRMEIMTADELISYLESK